MGDKGKKDRAKRKKQKAKQQEADARKKQQKHQKDSFLDRRNEARRANKSQIEARGHGDRHSIAPAGISEP